MHGKLFARRDFLGISPVWFQYNYHHDTSSIMRQPSSESEFDASRRGGEKNGYC